MNSMEFDTSYQAYLLDGEYVVWKGRPEKGNLLTPSDYISIPFGIIFFAFSLFWEFSVLQMGAPFFFPIFGLIFVCVGFYLMIGRFFHQASLKKKTYYVITNKKLIIQQGNTINMYEPHNLPPMEIYLHQNGYGTIRFTEYYISHRGRRRSHSFSLENIPDVIKAQNALNSMER